MLIFLFCSLCLNVNTNMTTFTYFTYLPLIQYLIDSFCIFQDIYHTFIFFLLFDPSIMTFLGKIKATDLNYIITVIWGLNWTDQWHFFFMKNQFLWKTQQIRSLNAVSLSKSLIPKLFLLFLVCYCPVFHMFLVQSKRF